MKISGLKYFLYCFLFLFFLTSCATVPKYDERRTDWDYFELSDRTSVTQENLQKGCIYSKYCDPEKPIILHVVSIPLDREFSVTSSPKKIYSDGSVKRETTINFAKRTNSFVAFNTIPFRVHHSINPVKKAVRVYLCGIYQENGKKFSEPIEKYSALNLLSDNSAEIILNQSSEISENAFLTVGGFFSIVRDGKKYGEYIDNKRTRSAVGISKDGKTLVIMVCEGQNRKNSRGMNYSECGDFMLSLGVWNALCFDAGHSADLCINGKSVLTYKVFRKVALSLGFLE